MDELEGDEDALKGPTDALNGDEKMLRGGGKAVNGDGKAVKGDAWEGVKGYLMYFTPGKTSENEWKAFGLISPELFWILLIFPRIPQIYKSLSHIM